MTSKNAQIGLSNPLSWSILSNEDNGPTPVLWYWILKELETIPLKIVFVVVVVYFLCRGFHFHNPSLPLPSPALLLLLQWWWWWWRRRKDHTWLIVVFSLLVLVCCYCHRVCVLFVVCLCVFRFSFCRWYLCRLQYCVCVKFIDAFRVRTW